MELKELLSQFLTPALIVSAAVYVTRLSGKIIADQTPFCDNRKWHIEFSGLLFFASFIAFPSLMSVLLSSWVGYNWLFSNWISYITISSIFTYLLLNFIFSSTKFFSLPTKLDIRRLVDLKQDEKKAIKNWFQIPSKPITLQIISFVLIFFAITIYQKSEVGWLLFLLIPIFLSFIFIAAIHSLRVNKLPLVNIYFKNHIKPLIDCVLIKVNEDNVRLRKEDKILILNKNEILKIEMDIKNLVQ